MQSILLLAQAGRPSAKSKQTRRCERREYLRAHAVFIWDMGTCSGALEASLVLLASGR